MLERLHGCRSRGFTPHLRARNGNRFALNFGDVMASFIHLNAMGNRVRQVEEATVR
jgi:hypothetical protein